jgi:ABC-2 type transport system permease protein
MEKMWLIARYEFSKRVFQKGFVLALISFPLIIVVMFGLIAFSVSFEESDKPIGYVDQSGVLEEPLPAPQREGSPDEPGSDKLIPMQPYVSEEAAREALEADVIQAYFVIAPDYAVSNQVELVYFKEPGGNVHRQFWDFMQINRLSDLPVPVASRAVAGSNVVVYWLEDDGSYGREFSQETFVNTFWPLVVGMGFVFMLLSSSGYLMGAVAEEKESRTMEIMVTSVSAFQLIIGKVAGILGCTVTQLTGGILVSVLGVYIGGNYLGLEALQNLTPDLSAIGTMAAVAVPSFVMVAALMTAVGATVGEVQEAQQMTGLFTLPAAIPLWLTGILIENPDSPISIVLSLLPITSVSAFSLRMTFGRIPLWQTASAIAISSVCAAGALWFASRAFRLGMLRYGQRLNLREVVNWGKKVRS